MTPADTAPADMTTAGTSTAGITPAVAPGPVDRGPSDAPVRRLTVLYDQDCPLCRHVRSWLERQRTLVPLDFVPAGTEQARQRFPALDHARTLREITAVGDGGQVYEGAAAWVVVLWALSALRPMAHRFSTPSGAQFARGMVLTAAKWRGSSRAAQAARSARRPTVPSRPPVPSRPTAQGTAGRRGAPLVPMGEWAWNGRSWEPVPCGDNCATDGG